MRVVSRYILFQIPGTLAAAGLLWALHRYELISLGLAVSLLAVWIVKDCIQYPFVRRAYDGEPSRLVGAARLLDMSGFTEEALDPDGWVRVGGELWRAEAHGTRGSAIPAGTEVRVHAVRNLTLLVQPANEAAPEPESA